jgi:hypothetical protein
MLFSHPAKSKITYSAVATPGAVLALVLWSASSTALAQTNPFLFEITPYVAHRAGGDFSGRDGGGQIDINASSADGLIFNVMANPNGQYELLYARQRTDADTEGLLAGNPTIDMDVEHFHFGGTYLFDGDNTRPFIALTLGMSLFDPRLPGTDSESFFSASFGAGVHLSASNRLGVRLEARAYTTFIDNDSDIFCSSIDGVGACLFQVDARTLTQWEARAGVVFRF